MASLRARLFVTYLATASLTLAMIALTLLAFLSRSPASRARTYEHLETTAFNLQQRETDWESLSRIGKRVYLQRLEQSTNIHFVILGDDGSVVEDSRPGVFAPPEEVLNQLGNLDDIVRGEYIDARNANWLYVMMPLGDENTMLLALPGPTLRSSLVIWGTDFLLPLGRAAGLALLLSAVFAWWVSHTVSSPLKKMASATKAIAQGESAVIDSSKGPEDIRTLAAAFNTMASDLHASQQAQRDFVANVSHDLKTPLTSIQGFAQALLDGTASDEESRKQAARVIYEESDRMHRLVEDLLELARLDAGQIEFKREHVDLALLLGSVLEGASLRAVESGVSLVLDSPESSVIIGDGDRLAQVFTNLIDNAIKHSPGGGVVRVWSKVEGGWITVHIDDQGAGIPEEELSRIFERFYQLDKSRSSGRGVGLGLAIVKEIVTGHGGRIVAQSSPDKGSRFTVQLPIARSTDVTIALR
ncbi:MAG: HAMP domain-containing histidine kinase [Anaerolineales bacterium]|nr:HAMP domain-containing histidine kinase [Anaerolineales bacterium]